MEQSSQGKAAKRKWRKKEEPPAKSWPGPPLAKTIQGKHVHRDINLGELKNAPRPIKKVAVPANLIPEEEEPAEEEEKEKSPEFEPIKPRKHSGKTDFLAVTVLWSWDILHNTMNALNERYNRDTLTWQEVETLQELTAAELNLLLTVAPMMAMGTALTFSFRLPILGIIQEWKFWVFLGFMAFYCSGTIAGIVLAVKKTQGAAVALSWVAVGWYTVHPLRFWLIFHQKFPLSIRWSHAAVTCNILIIGIFDYIVTVLVKEADQTFAPMFYVITYSVMTVAAIAWIAATFFINRFLNEVHGDFDSVREIYAETEVIDSFDRRQKFISFALFVILICPAVIMPVMDAVFDLGLVKLPQNALRPDLGWISYRPDLVSFLLIVIIMECFLQCMKPIRNELNDLFLITASHIMYIIVTILFIIILFKTYGTRKLFPENGEAIIVVYSDKQEPWFIQIGEGINKVHLALTYVVLKNISADNHFRFRAANVSTGEVVYEDFPYIEASRDLSVNAYNFVRDNNSYRLFSIPFPPLTYSYNSRFVILNGLEKCDDFSDKKTYDLYFNSSMSIGVRVKGACLPLSLVWYEEGSDWEKKTPFKPPPNDGTSEVLEIPCVPTNLKELTPSTLCNKTMVLRMWKLGEYLKGARISKKRDVIPDFIVFKKIVPFQLYSIRLEESKNTTVPTVNIRNLLYYRFEGEQDLVIAMCLYGTALGMGWTSYLHFIWIQSPVSCRMFIVFGFFAVLVTIYSLSKRYITKFILEDVFYVVMVATLCFLWHLGANILFLKRWKSFRKTEQPQQPWRRY
ncbi:hypothetical protein GE061_009608 [Apolygus lucorum]|uniref:Transmembrane protein n=1 Tax=Apolygus lucorum TaxID=248454 RepID=A0A6A4K599_APOLU|nr:hypothetical protein GE061_009608 [Apolygus lucorum]